MKVEFNNIKKTETPTVQDGLNVQYSAAKRSGYKLRWYLLLVVIVLPIALLAWNAIRPIALVLAPGIVTVEPLEIRSNNEANVKKLLIKHGEKVVKGQALVILSNAELNARITELQRQLDDLNHTNIVENTMILKRLNEKIETAQKGVKRQDELITVFRDFENKGIVPTSDMAAILQANTLARIKLSEARIDLLNFQKEVRENRLTGKVEQQKNTIKLELSKLLARKEQLTIKAPFTGKVIDILIQDGEHIITNQPLAWISGRDEPVVISYVNAKYLNYVSVGQKATINLPNGESVRAEIKEKVTLVSRIPSRLSGPFDGKLAAMKVVFSLDKKLKQRVEGVPVEIHFDYQSLVKQRGERD
ncbi:MAG: HlyD family secretion protein [Colwellia sp.]